MSKGAQMKELKAYAEALLAWADGKPIQYRRAYCEWSDWEGEHTYDNVPSFPDNDVLWRVKPGKEIWYRNFLTSYFKVSVANAPKKDLLINDYKNWINEPRSVWIDE